MSKNMTADPYSWRRRLGRFVLSRRFMEDWPAGVMLIQSRVRIMQLDVDWTTDNRRYIAQGDVFDIVPEGEEVPLYALVIHHVLGKTCLRPVDVSWQRAENSHQYEIYREEAA